MSTIDPAADLRKSFAHSVAWTAGARWGGQLVAWASTLVVARILSPNDFGLVSMASVYLGIVHLVSEFGIGSAIVTLRNMPLAHLPQLNMAAVLIGVAAFVVSCLLAVPMGNFYHAVELPPIVVAMSVGFIIGSFRSVPNALLQRDMSFKRLALIEAAQSLLLSATSVVLAMMGFRYWTLVIGSLLSAVLSTSLTLALCRKGFAWPRWRALAPAISFSWNVLIARMAWYVYANADFFVAGWLLGKEALGAYTLAWVLGSVPIEKISVMIFNVTPSYFSALQRNIPELRRHVLQLTEGIALLTVPLTIGLALVAEEFVHLALGPKWVSMIAPLRLLAAYASIRSITPLIPQVLTVTGDVRFSMWNSIAAAVVLPAGFAAGARWGITGIAAAWLLVHPLVLVLPYRRAFHRLELPFRGYFTALWPAIHSALLMAITVSAAKLLIPQVVALPIRFGALVLVGVGTYVAALLVFHRQRVAAIVRAVRSARAAA